MRQLCSAAASTAAELVAISTGKPKGKNVAHIGSSTFEKTLFAPAASAAKIAMVFRSCISIFPQMEFSSLCILVAGIGARLAETAGRRKVAEVDDNGPYVVVVKNS